MERLTLYNIYKQVRIFIGATFHFGRLLVSRVYVRSSQHK